MAGDGVSLPTTLAQLGNVAKAQARATAVSQPTTPFADLAEQKGVVKAHRVQETQAQAVCSRLRTLPGLAMCAISRRPSPSATKISLGDTLGRPMSSTVASQQSTLQSM